MAVLLETVVHAQVLLLEHVLNVSSVLHSSTEHAILHVQLEPTMLPNTAYFAILHVLHAVLQDHTAVYHVIALVITFQPLANALLHALLASMVQEANA